MTALCTLALLIPNPSLAVGRDKGGIKKPAHEAPVLIALLEGGGLHHTLGAQVILVGPAEVADAVFGQLQNAGRQG